MVCQVLLDILQQKIRKIHLIESNLRSLIRFLKNDRSQRDKIIIPWQKKLLHHYNQNQKDLQRL